MLMGKVFTVTEINRIVKNLLEGQREFANIQVQGELSNFRLYPSGHCYFNLKDKQGVLKAVMFAGNAARLKFIPKNGDSVLVIGRVGVYERDGIYQIYVDIMLPLGAGNLMLAYEALKNKLSAEGLFAAARKKTLPPHPTTVGIITSSAGAAVRDIITVSRRRNPGIKLILYPVRVQGKEAIAEIVEAIEFMNRENLAEVLIVGRGGGSIEDLWAFNEEKVVRAIAASHLPIVSAVGHEIDFTLADFVADVRAATPSAAAEIVVSDSNILVDKVNKLVQRNIRSMEHLLVEHQGQLNNLQRSWVFNQPYRFLEEKRMRVDRAYEQLNGNLEKNLVGMEHALGILQAKLETLSPLAILNRGYTVTERTNGKLAKSMHDVQVGDQITTRFFDGSILAKVVNTIGKADS
jgi:exodeoxyribonuclease VII large subunit